MNVLNFIIMIIENFETGFVMSKFSVVSRFLTNHTIVFGMSGAVRRR